jgi:DNA-binding NarL/FixJ family response regulator
MTAKARILIVDDHPLVREGLAARLTSRPELTICGEADSVDAALALLDSTEPDLVIVDLSLRSGHGLDLIKKIRLRRPSAGILVVSAYDESLFAARALRAGALGYVNKQEVQDRVLDGVAMVLRGERYVSAKLTQQLLSNAIEAKHRDMGIQGLSDRELEIFELIGLGKSTRNIAEQLHLSVHTIETHRENIRAKLSLQNGAELVRSAVQWVLESRQS